MRILLCIRPIFFHQAYASIYLIKTEELKDEVLFANQIGIDKA